MGWIGKIFFIILAVPTTFLFISPVAGAAGESDEERVPIAVMDLEGRNVDEGMAHIATELVVAEISKIGIFTVISQAEVRVILQRAETAQQMGCQETGCVAEIGAALGASRMVSGSISKLGDEYILTLQITEVNQARAENRVEESFPASEGDLASNIRSAARLLVQPLLETRSGFLFVEANEWGAKVYLDGRLIGTTPVGRYKASSGYHRVRVQKDNFIVWQRDVKVAPEQATSVAVGLIPSPDYVKAFRHQQRAMDISAWSTLGVGLASLVSGVGVLTWNELERGNYNDKRDLWVRCLGEPALPECGGIDTSGANSPYYQDLRKRRDDIKTRSAVSGALLGVGSVTLITSVVLFILEEDPAKYDHLVDEDGRPILQKEQGQAQYPTAFGTQRRFPVGRGRSQGRSLYGHDWRIDVTFYPNQSGCGIEFMFRF